MAGRNGQGAEGASDEDKARVAAQVVANVVHLAGVLTEEDCAALVRVIDRAKALGPVLDPTRFLREAETIAASGDVARAFLAFWREADKARAGLRLRRGSPPVPPRPAPSRG